MHDKNQGTTGVYDKGREKGTAESEVGQGGAPRWKREGGRGAFSSGGQAKVRQCGVLPDEAGI